MARNVRSLVSALTFAGALACGEPETRTPLDLSKPGDTLLGFVKTRGSIDPEQEVVFYWTGFIYSSVQESSLPVTRSNKVLFKFEGYNITRFQKTAEGYQQLSREASFYEDPTTGEILECWNNPLNGRSVSVVHVWNDPVNNRFGEKDASLLAHTEDGDRVVYSTDILLAYPSPLPVAQYPDYSGGNLYQAAELFNFYVSRAALEDSRLVTVPADISWTRVGPYLPWMQMGSQPGQLIYQTHGRKLMGGWAELPPHLRDYVTRSFPEYQHAPTEWPAGQGNATSWRYFKQLVDSGQYKPSCP
ncbi:DUF1838 domain-containing protein [Cystobacter fuscus]|uniref:DUF1838 family protein n=1 Tax=Cystobacter fuscus TaxID=43 RepID=UPI002B28D9E7|nr:DUF1838 domain-containing protein [Cystobacter fuscus]